MGIDIHIGILGMKETDGFNSEPVSTLYRVPEIYFKRKDVDEDNKFEFKMLNFPYFKNSFFFGEMRDRFDNMKLNINDAIIENPSSVEWYLHPKEGDYLFGYSYVRMKELYKWRDELVKLSKKKKNYAEEYEEFLYCVEYIIKNVELMLKTDEMLVEEGTYRTVTYNIENSVLLFAFDN